MLEAWIPTLKRAAPLRTSIETLTISKITPFLPSLYCLACFAAHGQSSLILDLCSKYFVETFPAEDRALRSVITAIGLVPRCG